MAVRTCATQARTGKHETCKAAETALGGLMPEISPSKYLVTAGWNDVPHLDEKTKAELRASTPPHLRDAREHGTPSLGIGAIYPVPLSEVLCAPFSIPAYWPRCYALDVGWNRTAAVWGALDQSTDTWYLYTEHYRGQAEPSVHATAIKARGEWIPGLIDPAARGRAQKDGERLIDAYTELGLKLVPYKNAVEAGIYAVWERLSTGRLRIFRTLQNWQAEYRLYRRDEKGAVVKEFDHLMDCTRGLIMSGREVARVKPVAMDGPVIGSAGGGDPTIGY